MAFTPIRIGPEDHGRLMTLDQFQEADEEEGFRYELARGALDVIEVPGDAHGKVENNLHETISDYRRRNPGRILRCGGGPVYRLWIPRLSSVRLPDLAIVLQDTPKDNRGFRKPSWGRANRVRAEGGASLRHQARGVSHTGNP